MSTKVYTAYRLRRTRDMWPFVADTVRRGEAAVQKALREFYQDTAQGVDLESEEFKKAIVRYENLEKAQLAVADKLITEGYRAQLGAAYRNPFNFDVCIAIRELRGRLYLIPHCDWMVRHTLDFLAEDPRLEDYSYWNNTERPEEISSRQWSVRGAIWDAIDQNGWENHVVLPICDWSNYWKVSPFTKMLQELGKSSKESPPPVVLTP